MASQFARLRNVTITVYMADKQPPVSASAPGRLERRSILKSALIPGTALLTPPALGAAPKRTPAILLSANNAVVNTAYGKVRGYTEQGIHTFKGIPYAASTAGRARFQPPSKPEPWKDVRDSLQYGHVAPWLPRSWVDISAYFWEYDDGRMGEDCLNLNIWTPAVNDGLKRPVMFWLHGGGFTTGSSQELKAYDGANLARRGDVVVVSINHRLKVSDSSI